MYLGLTSKISNNYNYWLSKTLSWHLCIFFHSPRKSHECMLHLCMTAWGFTHFLQHLLSSKCLASGALHRLGNFLLLASFGDNCCEICHSFRPLTSSAYAVCKRKVSWLFSRGQPLFGEISVFLFFICSLLFNLFPKLHLLWAHVRGKKKNANDICSNWFQQKTRDPWHHVFYLKRCLLEYLFWCAMETF